MNITRTVFVTAFALLSLLVSTTSDAVALRPNKATDDSVCDLSHDTNAFLGSTVLVPAVASTKDQIDAFFRLSASFVAAKCSNGQVLILQGVSSINIDAPSLSQVASSSCSVASIVRTEMISSYGGRSKPSFELRCTISKHDELVHKLADLERTDPMESLKARMVAAVRGVEQDTAPNVKPSQDKKDCNKVTLATLLRGGSCP